MPRLRELIRQHRIFPRKGVTSNNRPLPLSVHMQKRLDGMMVSTMLKTKAEEGGAAEASTVYFHLSLIHI